MFTDAGEFLFFSFFFSGVPAWACRAKQQRHTAVCGGGCCSWNIISRRRTGNGCPCEKKCRLLVGIKKALADVFCLCSACQSFRPLFSTAIHGQSQTVLFLSCVRWLHMICFCLSALASHHLMFIASCSPTLPPPIAGCS